jgi:benzoate membrane transport protein
MPLQMSVVASALDAALVGFGGTLAIIVAAAQAVGADAAQTSSWVTALCLSMAATSGLLSVRHRLPVITAWSTPGAALIAATGGAIGLEAAVGAFLLSGALVVTTASFRPVGGLIQRLPAAVAAGMLAGVLLRFVVAPFESAQTEPMLVLPLIALFLVARLASPIGAVLIVLAAGVLLAAGLGLVRDVPDIGLSTLRPVAPAFEPAVLVGLGVPLFLVTMASQNVPGFAVLRAAGYREVPTRSILTVTGLASLATAPFGAHATNLAAITASICAGPKRTQIPRGAG